MELSFTRSRMPAASQRTADTVLFSQFAIAAITFGLTVLSFSDADFVRPRRSRPRRVDG